MNKRIFITALPALLGRRSTASATSRPERSRTRSPTRNHPIMQGMSDFTIPDEAFFLITKPTLSPEGLHVLATGPMPKSNSAGEDVGEVVSQICTYERPFGLGQTFRSFVWMQGHTYANFADPRVQPMILRGIAWAAKWPIDALMTVRQPQGRGRGGRGA